MDYPFEKKLRSDAAAFHSKPQPAISGLVEWSCPSNIAIIKYWGKTGVQLPLNPSFSMTLEESVTRTSLTFAYEPGNSHPEIQFLFEGKVSPLFEDRIRKFAESLNTFMPVLSNTDLKIESENTFPHSSGIASSASSLGALALCLVQMEEQILGRSDPIHFKKKASFIARLGSGSASRSIFPNFALWGAAETWDGSSDEFAIPVTGIHDSFFQIRDTILIVESGSKKVTSSVGHSLMESNPFSKTRFRQARENLALLKRAMKEGDWALFITLMEEEALTLHAMMMTGRPGYILMKPGSLSIIQKVREFRKDTGCDLGFTMDAGANVHLLYGTNDAERVDAFIASELLEYCEDGRIIRDRIGQGPKKLSS